MTPARVTVLVVAALLLGAGDARAGVASMTESSSEEYKSGTLYYADIAYDAGPGEANAVTLREGRRALLVRDEAGVTAGPGCTATGDPRVVSCTVREYLGSVQVRLGDGDDRLGPLSRLDRLTRLAGGGSGVRADGGEGDDVIVPGSGNLRGGPGRDVLKGSVVNGGPGADDLTGALVSYAGHPDAVTADLDGMADDGAAGEGDRIDAAASAILGGPGDDALTGDARDNKLEGAGGDDRVEGDAGQDLIGGGAGADTLRGGEGEDFLVGPGGADVYDVGVVGEGPDGPDVLTGGPGRDGLRGGPALDALDGGAGIDVVEGGEDGADVAARDGGLDYVTCAGDPYRRPLPAGTAVIDAADLVRGCQSVDRAGEGRPRLMLLGQTDVDPDGTVRVGLACSQDQPGGCRGSVRLERGRRTLARRAFTIAGGTSDVALPQIPYRVFRRTRDCSALRLTAVIALRTTAGRRFTIRRRVALNAQSLRCNAPSLLLVGPQGGW